MKKSSASLERQDQDAAHVCVVYHPKTGKVVHVHEFVGKGFKPEACARTAMETVASIGHVEAAGHKVLHAPKLTLSADTMLRVHPKTLEIISKVRRDPRRPFRRV